MYNAVDVNTAYNNCIKIIDNLFIKYCPITIIKSKRIFWDKPWMTIGLKNSCKKKINIAFLKSKTLHKKYKNKLFKTCKQKYFSDLISRHKNNNVEMWKVHRNITCKKQSHINKLPDVFIDNNREYKEDEITEGYNTFLPTLVLFSKADYLTMWIFFDTLPNSNCNSMLPSKTDAKEILSIVKKALK